MTNDAKLGMLVGVIGVVVAAVLFGNPAPQPASAPANPPAPSKPVAAAASVAPPASPQAAAAVVAVAPREPSGLPATPVVRTRKEIDAQPTSRRPADDEEP
jgi:predicted lipid-binding transport protein (Tim44 family)